MPEIYHCMTVDCHFHDTELARVRSHNEAFPSHVVVKAWVGNPGAP